MPVSVELQLICKICEQQDFNTVIRHRITEEFFFSDDTKQAFRYIQQTFHSPGTFGSVPSFDKLYSIYPTITWAGSWDTLDVLCESVRLLKMRADLFQATQQIQFLMQANPREAADYLRDAAAHITAQHTMSQDMELSGAYHHLVTEYHNVVNHSGITGIPWPWQILNEDNQGIHRGEFYVFYGRPKSMKSWVALYVAANAYLAGYRVLIFSCEMPHTQVLRRCAALYAGVDYDKFKKGRLTLDEYNRVFGMLAWLRDQEARDTDSQGLTPSIKAVGRDAEGGNGVSALQAKIREFRPDLVLVDGMYLMRDDRGKVRTIDWKAIAHISQDLKLTAGNMNVPIIGVTQANRKTDRNKKEADLDEIAYADALAQDCDMAMRIVKKKDQQTGLPELVLSFPGSREGVLDAFLIHGIPATNFTFKRVLTSADMQEEEGNGGGKKKQQQSGNAVIPVLPFQRYNQTV